MRIVHCNKHPPWPLSLHLLQFMKWIYTKMILWCRLLFIGIRVGCKSRFGSLQRKKKHSEHVHASWANACQIKNVEICCREFMIYNFYAFCSNSLWHPNAFVNSNMIHDYHNQNPTIILYDDAIGLLFL